MINVIYDQGADNVVLSKNCYRIQGREKSSQSIKTGSIRPCLYLITGIKPTNAVCML